MMTLEKHFDLIPFNSNNLTLKKTALREFPRLKNKFIGFNNHIGIEVEVENIIRGEFMLRHPLVFEFWDMTDDGSLRNHGVEFVSKPLRGLNISAALYILYDAFNKYSETFGKPDFSSRCGLHVHVNCRQFTMQQLRNLFAVYMALESVIFNYIVKDERDGNPFCFPVVDSVMTGRMEPIKYQALNRRPLREQGTLEFRHMKGTPDVNRVEDWIKVIASLVSYSTSLTNEEVAKLLLELNSVSQYDLLVKQALKLDGISNNQLEEDMKKDVYVARFIYNTNRALF